MLSRERIKLQRTLGGIREMTRTPSAIWVVDTNKEHLAVNEARKLGIPVVAILDTNCDPDVVDYKIPGNDDAIRSIGTLTRVIADAVAEGLMARAGASAQATSKPEAGQLAGDEPLPDWETELLTGGAAQAAGSPTRRSRRRRRRRPPPAAERPRRRGPPRRPAAEAPQPSQPARTSGGAGDDPPAPPPHVHPTPTD